MKLAISNLAFPAEIEPRHMGAWRQLGLSGIEVVPTRIAPWDELHEPKLRDYRHCLSDQGLEVPSLQALLFGTEGLHLLRSGAEFEALMEHLKKVTAIGVALGARVGVFGSPKNRLRGDLPEEAAWDLACERFALLGRMLEPTGFRLVLEPVPIVYGADFLCYAEDVMRMVSEVDSPAIAVHLDTGCALLAGERIGDAVIQAGAALRHFHISEPKLGPFRQTLSDHAAAAVALRDIDYGDWISIEMLQQEGDPLAEAEIAIKFATSTYRSDLLTIYRA